MRIGVGLPNTIPNTEGHILLEWARRAEEYGFSTLATIDRVAYPSYESLIALAAAGAVTQKIKLFPNVLLAPTRNPVLLAKEAASVDQLSGGRLRLGLGVGSRPDDYTAAGQEFSNRGRRFDEALELYHKAWEGELVAGADNPVSPTPVNGRVPILIGGRAPQTAQRTAKWGIGWTQGGAPPEAGVPVMAEVRQAWKEAGREGEPEFVALVYYALGDNAEERARNYLTGYYGDWGSGMAAGIPKDADALRDRLKRYQDVGFTEVIFDPTIAELPQLETLAQAVL